MNDEELLEFRLKSTASRLKTAREQGNQSDIKLYLDIMDTLLDQALSKETADIPG